MAEQQPVDDEKEPETETVVARVPNGLTARAVEQSRTSDERFAQYLRSAGTFVEKVWGL